MKVKCFACALVAGLALSAVAVADPGVKQADGQVLQASPEVQAISVSAKNANVRRGKYYVGTGRIEMEGESSPIVRGPAPIPVWQAIDWWGFYNGQTGAGLTPGNPNSELYDWGFLCGDPLVDTHTIQTFGFGYGTGSETPGNLTVNIYWDYALSACTPPVNGNCLANQLQTFNFVGLPGDTTLCDGFVDVLLFDAILTPDPMFPVDPVTNPDLTFTMPAGDFGYGYSGWTGWSSTCAPTPVATGGMLVNENLITAPGADDNMDFYTAAPQAGYLGRGGFGGNSQLYFELTGLVACDPVESGACCVADVCTVEADEAACTTLGGTFSIGLPCATFFCVPAPANDDCLGAEVISGFNQFNFDNRGATTGGEGASSCVAVTEDVWFSWQAHCTGSITLSTCLENLTDDAFTVYQGNDCGNLAIEVACDDDGCGVVGGQSSLTFAVTDSTNYLIRIGTWGNTDGGMNTFTIANAGDCVEGSSCDADWCNDGVVGVPDIFCFLTEWFALVPEARNYGGTPGVPAIFAFLSAWFANGIGPCLP